MGLTNDYQYEFEEEKKQTNKKSDKEEPPKKPTKTDVRELNELITKEETGHYLKNILTLKCQLQC